MKKEACTTLSAHESANYIGISYWLILELAKQGLIPHIRVGKRVLFRKETLDKWLEDKEERSVSNYQ